MICIFEQPKHLIFNDSNLLLSKISSFIWLKISKSSGYYCRIFVKSLLFILYNFVNPLLIAVADLWSPEKKDSSPNVSFYAKV